jgi:hypothetical protein
MDRTAETRFLRTSSAPENLADRASRKRLSSSALDPDFDSEQDGLHVSTKFCQLPVASKNEHSMEFTVQLELVPRFFPVITDAMTNSGIPEVATGNTSSELISCCSQSKFCDTLANEIENNGESRRLRNVQEPHKRYHPPKLPSSIVFGHNEKGSNEVFGGASRRPPCPENKSERQRGRRSQWLRTASAPPALDSGYGGWCRWPRGRLRPSACPRPGLRSSRATASPAAVGGDRELLVVTWNLASPNNNPFEFWVSSSCNRRSPPASACRLRG